MQIQNSDIFHPNFGLDPSAAIPDIGPDEEAVRFRLETRTGDPSYEPGQRLVVQEGEVRELLRVVNKLIAALRTFVP